MKKKQLKKEIKELRAKLKNYEVEKIEVVKPSKEALKELGNLSLFQEPNTVIIPEEDILSYSINTLAKALKKDEVFFNTYVANIAMSFKDYYYRVKKNKSYMNATDVHLVANNAARAFLELLIKGSEDKPSFTENNYPVITGYDKGVSTDKNQTVLERDLSRRISLESILLSNATGLYQEFGTHIPSNKLINHLEREMLILEQKNDSDKLKGLESGELIIKKYIPAIKEIIRLFVAYDHPYSINYVAEFIKSILNFEIVSPLRNKHDGFLDKVDEFHFKAGFTSYQNLRISSVFKEEKDSDPYYIDCILWVEDVEYSVENEYKDKDDILFKNSFKGIVEGISSAHFIRFPFMPKTFEIEVERIYLDSVDKEEDYCLDKENRAYSYRIKDKNKLKEVFEYYDFKGDKPDFLKSEKTSSIERFIEYGVCDICGLKKSLERTYYEYENVVCGCCDEKHTQYITHCESCVPKKPTLKME